MLQGALQCVLQCAAVYMGECLHKTDLKRMCVEECIVCVALLQCACVSVCLRQSCVAVCVAVCVAACVAAQRVFQRLLQSVLQCELQGSAERLIDE